MPAPDNTPERLTVALVKVSGPEVGVTVTFGAVPDSLPPAPMLPLGGAGLPGGALSQVDE